jgi:hypothetical protein
MVKISGWVYLAIGAVVSLFSRYVQNRGGKGLAIFFWAGIILIGVGVFKIATGFMMAKEEDKNRAEKEKKGFKIAFNKDLEGVNPQQKVMQERQQAMNSINEKSADRSIIVCPRCGTKHYSNSNFCHMCGVKLR